MFSIQKFFENNPYFAARGPWIYALVITVIACLVAVAIGKISQSIKKAAKH